MKKVLIIGYFWPYHKHGSGRVLGLAKYLPEFGWKPVILTDSLSENKPLSEFKVLEVGFSGDIFSLWRKLFFLWGFKRKESITDQVKGKLGISSKNSVIDKLRTLYQEIFAYPDTEKKWKGPALAEAKKFLSREEVGAIISIWPVTSHVIAGELKFRYNIPWLADFPDPWSRSHNYPYGPIRRYFDERLEKKVISLADAITAASPLYSQKESELHKREVITVTNGFDPENISTDKRLLAKNFTIIYAGTIYTAKQDPEKFVLGLANLVNNSKVDPQKLEVIFYGPKQNWLDKLFSKYNLTKVIKQNGVIPRDESLEKQKGAHVLLLFNWEAQKEKGVYPLKFFEYLSSQRPILATGGFHGDYLEKMLSRTQAGIYASSIEEIENALLNFYEEYLRTGYVSYFGDQQEINKYSYREMAKNFAGILDAITVEDKK